MPHTDSGWIVVIAIAIIGTIAVFLYFRLVDAPESPAPRHARNAADHAAWAAPAPPRPASTERELDETWARELHAINERRVTDDTLTRHRSLYTGTSMGAPLTCWPAIMTPAQIDLWLDSQDLARAHWLTRH